MADEKKTATLAAAAARVALYNLPSYPRYLLRLLRRSHPYALYERLRTVFRPTVLIARILRVLRFLLTVVQTSAFLLLSATLFLVVLPFFLLFTLGLFHAAARERTRADRLYAGALGGRRVAVFFADTPVSSSLVGTYTVLVVTDSLPKKNPAAVACRHPDGRILLRPHYYFHLRRKFLKKTARTALLF